MSAFLGPIHHWLYKKIGNQEALTLAVANLAKNKGWAKDIAPYIKTIPPLEAVIDQGNIHGWLQEQIHSAENRFADFVSGVIAKDQSRINDILQTAFEFGKANGIDKKANAENIYKFFEDFFVNGMPCDRVNNIVSQGENEISWQMKQDIHAQYWNGRTENYYKIRKSVMDGMLTGTDFCVEAKENGGYVVKIKQLIE